ncbi:spore coat protein [Cytobacillus sp. S13-E01]|uniref:spore coat protein n=1 Tax=Cytobacillus sp. S13-E01 TaxID=3031326 RepID=UPI0023D83C58|nr:spore coat protein [Cytobacillus sp. S13-E01]MDF0728069.1 spore coat protein [Cytobacillus sp. S13-E01]
MDQSKQSPNQLKNPKTKVPKTPQMNDRDFINDMLATEKYMTDAYSNALNEASHEALYQDIRTIFNETQNSQRQLFNLMFEHGWYKLEAEEQQKVQQKHQQFYNYTTTQFVYPTNGMMQ